LRRAEPTRLNETVGVVARSLRLNEAVVAGREHGGQTRLLRPNEVVEAKTGPWRSNEAVEAETGLWRSNEAVEAETWPRRPG
jgi:hypothetical protein